MGGNNSVNMQSNGSNSELAKLRDKINESIIMMGKVKVNLPDIDLDEGVKLLAKASKSVLDSMGNAVGSMSSIRVDSDKVEKNDYIDKGTVFGLMLKRDHDLQRMGHLRHAIKVRLDNLKEIPYEWYDEYNGLVCNEDSYSDNMVINGWRDVDEKTFEESFYSRFLIWVNTYDEPAINCLKKDDIGFVKYRSIGLNPWLSNDQGASDGWSVSGDVYPENIYDRLVMVWERGKDLPVVRRLRSSVDDSMFKFKLIGTNPWIN